MSLDLRSGSSEFGQGNAVMEIVRPGVSGMATAIAPDTDRCLDSSAGRRAASAERSSAGRTSDRFVRTVQRFAYLAARRLLRLEVAHILALDLGPMLESPPETSSFEFRPLSADEIRRAASDAANDLGANAAGRLEVGRNFCFAAFDRGQLANYSWYALDHVAPEHSFGIGLTLPEDTIYLYQAFTLPAYRGRRLHQATVQRAVQWFAPMGIQRMVAIVEYGHWTSLRSHLRMGFRRVGHVCLLRRRPILWRCDSDLSLCR
jgi:GNAT superfamily N-acetyltransferase